MGQETPEKTKLNGHTAIVVLCLIALVVAGLAAIGIPVRSEQVGQGNLVIINGMNVSTMSNTVSSAGAVSTGSFFVGLNETGKVTFYFTNVPDILVPNAYYYVFKTYDIFGWRIRYYLQARREL